MGRQSTIRARGIRHCSVWALGACLIVLGAAPQASAAVGPTVAGPTVSSGGPSVLTESNATLIGGVIANGMLLDCHFEWGPSPSYGTVLPCSLGPVSPGTSEVPVSAAIAGLAPGTTYFWRLVATNEVTTTEGYPESFVTPTRRSVEEKAVPRGSGGSPRRPEPRDSNDAGLYVAYCPAGRGRSARASRASRQPEARSALASHAGWPRDQCLKMDKGSAGLDHTLDGIRTVHNWLLGGYGNDTIIAGDKGDVIWGDYQPAEQSESEHDRLHGGGGSDWIYSSHGSSEIWTGAGNDHVALIYGHGTVHCNGPGLKTFVMRFLAQNRHWKLIGCHDMRIEPYKA
jgi:hypothetical protein